jgi:hypothetical protein
MERNAKMNRANMIVALVIGSVALFFYAMTFLQHW